MIYICKVLPWLLCGRIYHGSKSRSKNTTAEIIHLPMKNVLRVCGAQAGTTG